MIDDRPSHAPLNPIAIADLMGRPASRRDRLSAGTFVVVLGALMATAIALGATRVPVVLPFVPICAAIWAAADLLTAYLLLSQFSVNGMRAFAILAGAYAFSGALTIPYLWYFPGLFSTARTGLGPQQISVWLWVCWHLVFPILVGGYQLFDRTLNVRITSGSAVRRWIIGVTIGCAAACTVVATVAAGANDRLPVLVVDGRFSGLFTAILAPAVVGVNLVAAIVTLSSRRPSRLQLWLGVALTTAALDGILNIFSRGRYSASWYVGKFETFAAAAIVLMVLLEEIGVLYRRLGGLATIDGLTGLSNRQAFDSDARFALQSQRRRAGALAFVVVDIDFFKQYNDTYGHQAGDACLQRVAASLRQTCARAVDLVGRFGGEEFVVLLPDTNAAGSRRVGEAIRHNVEALGIAHGGSRVGTVLTVSVGVVSMADERGVELETLFRHADAALYRAKVGRNAVIVDEIADRTDVTTAQREPAAT